MTATLTKECSPKTETITPQYRVNRLDQHFELDVFLPGVADSDLNLKVKDRVLRINATVLEKNDPDLRCIHQEFTIGDYASEFRLPTVVDVEQIKAHLKNGVLKVTLPKAKAHESRSIKVQAL